MRSIHKSVLLNETIGHLASGKPEWYLDGTLGGAGHVVALAEALNGKVNVIGLDRDQRALDRAAEILPGKVKKLILAKRDFRDIDEILDSHGIEGVDAILLDLGISSDELETSGRGFTFQKDEPLLMTMGEPTDHSFTAASIVNSWKEEDIANVIYAYGEDRFARRIARAIVAHREKKPLETTKELAEVVKLAVPPPVRRGKIHPATKTFQALRIAVNDELEALKEGLKNGWQKLNVGGKFAVISFHSLEDRIVKEFFRRKFDEGAGEMVTKKPIVPSEEEIINNPRSRSAKLRISIKK